MDEKYGDEKYLEEQIKIELDKMASNDSDGNLELILKLIEGYVEYVC